MRWIVLLMCLFVNGLAGQETGDFVTTRYQTSYLLGRGEFEIKMFNNLYTERTFDGFSDFNSRNTYFSSFMQVLFGSAERWNAGFDVVYKSNYLRDFYDSSPFKALQFKEFDDRLTISGGDTLRHAEGYFIRSSATFGLAHIGPKIKFRPVQEWEDLTFQQTFYVPVEKKVDGRYISFSQFFYDKLIKDKYQVFSEVSFWAPLQGDFTFQRNIFIKVFLSYFLTERFTIYGMSTIPYEYGLGAKFSILPNLEAELLYTYYLPIEYYVGFNRPETFNLGFRYTHYK